MDGQGKKGEVVENILEVPASLIETCEDELKMLIAQNDLRAAKVVKTLGNKDYAQSQASRLGTVYGAGKAKHKGQRAIANSTR